MFSLTPFDPENLFFKLFKKSFETKYYIKKIGKINSKKTHTKGTNVFKGEQIILTITPITVITKNTINKI